MKTCSACESSARPRSAGQDRSMLFLALGLAGGLLGAGLLARWRSTPREAEGLPSWRQTLARTRGVVEAGFVAGRVQAEYAALYSARPRFDQPALRHHLETSILPSLALFRVLDQQLPGDRESALAEFDCLMEAQVKSSTLALQAKLLGLFPDPYPIFHLVHNLMLSQQYPPEGWTFHWVEDSDRAVAYDCVDCFYLRVLTAYGVPELTAHFCHLDDVMFGSVPRIAWKRTTTLGRGDDRCNFRFERVGA